MMNWSHRSVFLCRVTAWSQRSLCQQGGHKHTMLFSCPLIIWWQCSVSFCNITTCCNVLYFSAEWQPCHILPCVSTVWPTYHSGLWLFVELPPDHCAVGFTVGWSHHHSVLCFSIRWILVRIYVFLYSVKSWSQCSMFLCRMVTWTRFSVFPCRLRPYHNDLYSPQGDHLIAQCVYNSEGRSTITLGGLTTREEMCLVFALYYPRIDMSLCHSLPSLPTVLHSLGIQELWPWVLICLLIVNFYIWFDGAIHSITKTFTQVGK